VLSGLGQLGYWAGSTLDKALDATSQARVRPIDEIDQRWRQMGFLCVLRVKGIL
jgi:hypothetical protein